MRSESEKTRDEMEKREQFKRERKCDDESIKKALSILMNSDHPYTVFWNISRAGRYDDRYVDFTEERGWKEYEREYSGTFYRWCEDGDPSSYFLNKIRRYLEPVASFLSLELTDEVVLKNNPATLIKLHGVGKLVAHISGKLTAETPYGFGSTGDIWVTIDIYELPGAPNRIVCLVDIV